MASSMTLDDLKGRFEGDLNTRYTDTYLEIKIEDAIALIDGDHPTVQSRITSGALSINNYKRIVTAIVFRVIRNPEGYTSENEGGAGYERNQNVASGDMWITDKEIETLTGVAPKGGRTMPATASIGIDAGWGP